MICRSNFDTLTLTLNLFFSKDSLNYLFRQAIMQFQDYFFLMKKIRIYPLKKVYIVINLIFEGCY